MTNGTDDRDEGRGLIRRSGGDMRRWPALAAAALVFFSVGLWTGRQSTSTREAVVTPRYALILYGGLEGDTGPEHVRRAREYGQWAAGLSGDARWVGGEELGRALFAYPDAAEQDPVVGFFVIEAASPDVAARIAQQCPHLKYGGRVVVHPVA
jgi:hypothetical protein